MSWRSRWTSLATQTRPLDHLIVVDNDSDDRGARPGRRPAGPDDLSGIAPKPRRRRRFRTRHAARAVAGRGLGLAGRRRRPARRTPTCSPPCWPAPQRHGLAEVSPDGVRSRRSGSAGVPAAPRPGVARRVSELHSRRGSDQRSAARHRVAVQRRTVPGVDAGSRWRAGPSAVRPRRRGGSAPPPGALRAAVRHLPGRGVPAPAGRRRVQTDPRRADAHPVPRRRDEAVLHLPQPRLPAVPTGPAQAAAAGVAAVRLVLPGGRAADPAGLRGVDPVAPLGSTGKVQEARR